MEVLVEFIVQSAVGVLKLVLKDPKKYGKMKSVVDELRKLVDEADDALDAAV